MYFITNCKSYRNELRIKIEKKEKAHKEQMDYLKSLYVSLVLDEVLE